MASGVLPDVGGRVFDRPRLFVGPGRSQGVEHIGDGDDSTAQRDGFAREPERIPRPVPFFVVAERDVPGQPQQVGALVVEQLGTNGRMRLHDRPLGRIELAGLEQDSVGNADFAYVVHRAREQHPVARVFIPAERPRQHGRVLAHAEDMEACLVVPVLGRASEATHDLEPRLVQSRGALPHHLLEQGFLVLEQPVCEVCVEEVAHPHQELGAFERLADEIACARGERTEQLCLASFGREDDDGRQQRIAQRLQLGQDLVAVGKGHVDVEQDEIGTPLGVPGLRLAWILDHDRRRVAFGAQQLVEQLEVRQLVVDDENACLATGRFVHEACRARGAPTGTTPQQRARFVAGDAARTQAVPRETDVGRQAPPPRQRGGQPREPRSADWCL